MKGKDKYLKVLEVLMIAFCFVLCLRLEHFILKYITNRENSKKKKIGEIKSQKNETDVGQGLKKKREQKREQEIL